MSDEIQEMGADARAEAAMWCMRLADGDMTLEAEAEFELWLAESDAHRAAFARASAVWEGAALAADAPKLIAVRADALESLRAANSGRWRRLRDAAGSAARLEWWRTGLAAAACLALVLFGSLILMRDAAMAFETGVGERRIVRLEDGSRLSLDAATRVEVAYGGERRTLRLLSGRAKFDVARDPLRPFSVAVGDRMVVATGTSFSVEIVQQQMRVILYEGSVAVMRQDPAGGPPRRLQDREGGADADQALRPGRELVAALDSPVATVSTTEPARSLSWENGVLSFGDEPLDRAIERVNRYSTVKIRAGDTATASLLVSGLFNAGDTEGFVDGVTALFPVQARRAGDTIELTSRRTPR